MSHPAPAARKSRPPGHGGGHYAVARVITRMNVGGPARHVTILAARSTAPRSEVLYTGREEPREGSLLEEAQLAGADIQVVPYLARPPHPLRDLAALVALYRHFRRTRPLIVATHTAKAGTVGRLAAFLARVPIRVHTFHGHVLGGYFGGALTWFYATAERLLATITTQFVAISPEIASELEEMGIGRRKITVIRLGLDFDSFEGAEPGRLRAELGLEAGTPLIGIVGRLAPVKAVDLFIEAAQLILEDVPAARFVVVGDGELWDELHETVVRAGLADKVSFTGWRHDLGSVYADLDVVVCCSRSEGTPASLIEAGAAGLPVVGTRVGGMADIISDGLNGFLVPSADRLALAKAVLKLVAEPDRARKMGRAGKRMSLERNASGRMAEEIDALYARLIESARR